MRSISNLGFLLGVSKHVMITYSERRFGGFLVVGVI